MISDEEFQSLNKESNRLSKTMRDYKRMYEKLTDAHLTSFRLWSREITLRKGKIVEQIEMTRRSKIHLKQVKINAENLEKHTEKVYQNRLVIQKNQQAMQDSHSKDVERHLLMRDSMKRTSDHFDFVTQSLTKGQGLVSIFSMLTIGGYNAVKATRSVQKAQREYDAALVKAKGNKDDKSVQSADTTLKTAKLNLKTSTAGSERLGKIAGYLSKAGDYFERHATGILIGAGAAGVLIGIIIKALSLAPMFQAMMKLMQFTVTMLLMPIGTFFGAILKPIMIGIVKGIAPQFKDWMTTSMVLGEKIGNWMVNFFTGKPLETLTSIATGVTQGDPASLLVAGGGVGTSIAGFAIAKKILPTILGDAKKTTEVTKISKIATTLGKAIMGTKTGLAAAGVATSAISTGSKIASTAAYPRLQNFGARVAKEAGEKVPSILGKTLPKIITGGIKLGFKAIPIVGWATLASDVAGSIIKHVSPETYEGIREGVKGIFGDNAAVNFGLDVLGFGEQSTAEMISGAVSGLFNPLKDAFGESEDIVSDVQIFENALNKMGTEDAPELEGDMIRMLDHFERMKELSGDATKAAANTADLFGLAYETVKSKISNWVKNIPSENKSESKDAKKILRDFSNSSAMINYNNMISQNTDNLGWGTTAEMSMEERAAAEVSNVIENAVSNNKHTEVNQRFLDAFGGSLGDSKILAAVEKAKTDGTVGFGRNEIARQRVIDSIANGTEMGDLMNPNWKPATDAQKELYGIGQQYGINLGQNFAAGGWIREPVVGIGRNSGQTYNIGERGAEYVTPNGGGNGGNVIINIGKIEKNADFNQLKPMIQRWILESNSRRGMI